jgi:hypothetical protein
MTRIFIFSVTFSFFSVLSSYAQDNVKKNTQSLSVEEKKETPQAGLSSKANSNNADKKVINMERANPVAAESGNTNENKPVLISDKKPAPALMEKNVPKQK